MTFVLKEYNELKALFNDTVDVFLKRAGKKTIDQLDSPRKEALQFLTAVIGELDRKNKELRARSTTLAPFARVLYGAMLVVCKDIEGKEGYVFGKKENSLLYTSLMDGMGISKDSIPSPKEYVDFYHDFNALTNIIFTDHDSRKGLQKEHALNKIPGDKLVELTKIGYRLENEAQNDFVKSLSQEGKSTQPKKSDFKLRPLTPRGMVEQFGGFKKLQSALHDLETTERAKKNKATVKVLANSARATQFQFLTTISASLQESSLLNDDRCAVLAGAMYLVRGQIALEYKRKPLYKKGIEASVTHDGLSTILNSTEECYEDMGVFLEAMNQFVRYNAIEYPDSEGKPISVRAKHMFTDIPNFDLAGNLTLIQGMLHESKDSSLDTCLDAIKKQQASKQSTTSVGASLFGYFGFTYNKAQKQEESEEEDEEEHTEETKASM